MERKLSGRLNNFGPILLLINGTVITLLYKLIAILRKVISFSLISQKIGALLFIYFISLIHVRRIPFGPEFTNYIMDYLIN